MLLVKTKRAFKVLLSYALIVNGILNMNSFSAAHKQQLEEIHITYFQTAKKFYENQNEIFEKRKQRLEYQVECAQYEKEIALLKKRKLELEVFQMESKLTR